MEALQGRSYLEGTYGDCRLDAGSAEQKKSLEIIMQIAAEVSKDTGKTGVYYWEPVGVPGKGMGTWFENMGMFDEHGRLCRAGMQSGL